MSFNILIVDNEQEIIDTIKEIITNELEHIQSIYTATDGKKAFDIVKNNHLDLIISDIKMPVMDGLEMYSKIKDSLQQKGKSSELYAPPLRIFKI